VTRLLKSLAAGLSFAGSTTRRISSKPYRYSMVFSALTIPLIAVLAMRHDWKGAALLAGLALGYWLMDLAKTRPQWRIAFGVALLVLGSVAWEIHS
jgi:hypothetical protein